LIEAREETGNSSEEIKYPLYCFLVSFLGDKKGLGNIEFGSAEGTFNSICSDEDDDNDLDANLVTGAGNDDSDDSDNVDYNVEHEEPGKLKRKAQVQDEVERQRAKRRTSTNSSRSLSQTRQTPVEKGFGALAESIKIGLIESAKVSKGSSRHEGVT